MPNVNIAFPLPSSPTLFHGPGVALSNDNLRLVKYCTKGAGTAIYNEVVAANRERYPEVHNEIVGM